MPKNTGSRPRIQTSQKQFIAAGSLWQRWGWTGLSSLFAVCCLGAGWWASDGAESQVRMAFLVLSLSFFLFGFFHYFYAIADFSEAHRQAEREHGYRPLPHPGQIVFFVLLGLVCIIGLVALWLWRR